MSDIRISFEYEFLKRNGYNSKYLLEYSEERESYVCRDTSIAFMWYCRGYFQGERG